MTDEIRGDVQFHTRVTPEASEKIKDLVLATGFQRRGRPNYKRFMEAIANSEYLDTGDRIILTFKKNT